MFPSAINEAKVTAHYVRSRFDYNPHTGEFRYKYAPRNQNRIKAGDLAGFDRPKTKGSGAYRVIKINGVAYKASRIAWLYCYGSWPEGVVDHWDENTLNNRLDNLRVSTKSQNGANRGKTAANTSGFKGVTKYGNRWRAQITFQQKVMHLGIFDTPEEAHEAYLKKAKELFGRFAHE